MTDEALENYRRKVRWQMRRGLLELDIILNRFIADGFAALNEAELRCLEEILTWDDQDLLQIVSGLKTVEEPLQAAIIQKIRNSNAA
ncbi:MAG: succinate dehydrogenase assembly factor 2 [Neisseria sp.]|nr:succinate dehydrogenase assembly factor 2 [Neisseria sp.]